MDYLRHYERLRRRGLSHFLALLWLHRWLYQPRMAITRVQVKSGNAVSNSVSVTFTSTTTAGNFLLACFFGRPAGAITAPSINWTQAIQQNDGAGTSRGAIYYYENAPATSSALTFSMAGASVVTLLLAEYSGVATSSSLDKTAGTNGSSANPITEQLLLRR